MMFAQHIANLSPIWGRTTGTGTLASRCSTVAVRR